MSALILCVLAMPVTAAPASHGGDYIREIFGDATEVPGTLWLTQALQQTATEILGHPYDTLRLRYWHRDGMSVWILDEIGKELPITVGIAIRDARVHDVRVLAFRESRGGEVRYPFFTDQFRDSGLAGLSLDRSIDGITGATMSVRAVSSLVRFALKLDEAARASETSTLAERDRVH